MDTQPSDEQGIDLSGRSLGPYKLDRRIGVGGTATVYRATHSVTGAEVALKVLHRNSDRMTVLRFDKEIALARTLCNPHVASIVMNGKEDGLYWVAMELKHGDTLRNFLKTAPRKRLRWEAAAYIVMNICGAVASMHEMEVVHRDLKPENIFLSRTVTGQLWITLLDLGIAKEFSVEPKTQEGVHLTERNELPGTGPYMAPERVRGQPCTPATDQYSLGVVLYECLNGQLPYPPSENYTALKLQVNSTLGDLTWTNVPEGLKAIVLQAMANDWTHRFPNVLAMAEALYQCLKAAGSWVDPSAAAMDLLEARLLDPPPRRDQRPQDEKTTDAARYQSSAPAPKSPNRPTPSLSALEDSQPDLATTQSRAAGFRVAEAAPGTRSGQEKLNAELGQEKSKSSRQTTSATPEVSHPATNSDAPLTSSTASRPAHEGGETFEDPAPNRLLAWNDHLLLRFMRISLTTTMIAIAGMGVLAGDPQWERLQKRWTEPEEKDVETHLIPPPPTAPTIRSASVGGRYTNQGTGRSTPTPTPTPTTLTPTPTTPTPTTPTPTTTTPTPAPAPTTPTPAPAPAPKLDAKAALAKAVKLVQRKFEGDGGICKLDPDSNVESARVCVELVIGTDGTPISGSVKSTDPLSLKFDDRRGAKCVYEIAKLHLNLRRLASIPKSVDPCFKVFRDEIPLMKIGGSPHAP